jgi:4-amino-4-deoxy-L-arabinose transferase-like glycosyltransferase
VSHRGTSRAVENRESSSARAHLCLAGLLAIIAFFYAATVRPGHVWGDDYAMYVHHAENIVEGRPYADTGYIYNPAVPVYGPRMYPPVFPLLLAPLYKVLGLNLIPMKLEQVVFFLLTLAAVYGFWRRDLGPGYALALVAILGFNPHFWAAKDEVLSDLPFLLFFYVAALLVRLAPREQEGWPRWAVLIGAVLYLAMGTRSAGIALIAGLVLYDLLQRRTITRLTAVALTVTAALALLQSHFAGSGVGSYLGVHVHPSLHTCGVNLMFYARVLAGFWVASTRSPFSFFVLGIVVLLMLAGIFSRGKRGLTIVEAFLAPYFAVIILWPFASGIRIVFPFIPWIVFLALSGLRGLSERLAPRRSTAAACGLLLLTAVPYISAYRKTDFGPVRESSGLPQFNQLCQAVRDHTGPGDVLIYYRARALSLYTGRAASTYDYHGTEAELWRYSQKIHAAYLITTNAFNNDGGFLVRYVEEYSSDFDLTYQNANFKLYRIRLMVGPGGGTERHDQTAAATAPPS